MESNMTWAIIMQQALAKVCIHEMLLLGSKIVLSFSILSKNSGIIPFLCFCKIFVKFRKS